MHVTVVSPEQAAFGGSADAVVAPAYDGQVGILPRHVPCPAASAGAPASRSQFAADIQSSSASEFGIGGRGLFSLQSLFPKAPLDGIVSVDYIFPSAPAGAGAHYREINGDVAYRFRVPRSSS